MTSVDVTFCVTSKSGLGHLARIHHIAHAMRDDADFGTLSLLTNAEFPSDVFHGHQKGMNVFNEVRISEKSHFTSTLAELQAHIVVIDTAVVPEVDQITVPKVLVMRETRKEKLPLFAPTSGKGWDLIIVPNPPDHWSPDRQLLPAHSIRHVGWIYDDSAVKPECSKGDVQRRILLCAGGGGNSEWLEWETRLQQLISNVSIELECRLHVTQLLGPRASASARFDWCDEAISSIAGLASHMEHYDLIITAAGYNTVLELARCTSPALLIALNRTFDDQYSRAEQWAAKLGHLFDPEDIPRATAWCAEVLDGRGRRNRVQLGASGAASAAALVRQVTQKSLADLC